jgi:hypothetical protein
MVLLCFFIMFFSIDGNESRTLFAEIVSSTKLKTKTSDSDGVISTVANSEPYPIARDLASIIGSPDNAYTVIQDSKAQTLHVDFPDDIFVSAYLPIPLQ